MKHHHHDEPHDPVTDFQHNDDETSTDKHDHAGHHHHNDCGHVLYCPTANDYDCLAPIVFKATDYDDFHFGPADHNHEDTLSYDTADTFCVDRSS